MQGWDKIGFHCSVKYLLQQNDEFFKNNKTFQVFIGSPRGLKVPSFIDLQILKQRHPDIDVVVHMPYVVSLCKSLSEKIQVATLSYEIQVARELQKCGCKYMVTHIGGLSKGTSIKQGTLYIWDFCNKWLQSTEGLDVVLCLENDSGSKAGTKMGYLKILTAIVNKINSPRIRLCLDTEHAYGAGVELTDEVLEHISKYIDVVHYNAIPEEVKFGGHLDRHSTTSFYKSKVDVSNVYRVLYNGVRPFIFEVNGEPYVSLNKRWLKENVLQKDTF